MVLVFWSVFVSGSVKVSSRRREGKKSFLKKAELG